MDVTALVIGILVLAAANTALVYLVVVREQRRERMQMAGSLAEYERVEAVKDGVARAARISREKTKRRADHSPLVRMLNEAADEDVEEVS